MFTIHDIIEIAIKVETNGAKTYQEAADRTKNAGLSELLSFLARDELDHIRWFEKLASTIPEAEATKELEQMGRSMLRGVVADMSFSLDDVDLAQSKSFDEVLDAALELELDTALFYQMLAGFVNDDVTLAHLATIIEEEKRHGRFLLDYLQNGHLPSKQEYNSVPT